MKGKQIVAIDVGSSNVVIAVGSLMEDGCVDIMGIVSEPVTGIRAGRIDNGEQVARAIALAKAKIEKQLGVHITEVYAGISGDYVRCSHVEEHVYVQEEGVSNRDIEELDRRMQCVKAPDDSELIVSSEPLRYKVDDKEVGEPNGAYGNRLSATYNFVLCDKKMRDRLSACLKSQGITVKEFVPNTTISHLGVATSDEIQDGAVVINLGAQLTDVTVLQKGKVTHIASIPMGANDINTDITSLGIGKYVEDLKIGYGSALADRCDDDLIVFPQKYHIMVKSLLRRNLVIAIEARLVDIAGWVNREIKEAKCGSRFRPVVLLTGGGSRMRDIEELFKREIACEDVRVVYPEYGITPESMEHISSQANATVVSLMLYGAKRGSCSVIVKPQGPTVSQPGSTPTSTPAPEPQRPAQNTTTIPPVKAVEEQPKPQQPAEPEQVVETPTTDVGEEIIDVGPDVEKGRKKGLFGGRFTKWVEKTTSAISKSMSADDEQNF